MKTKIISAGALLILGISALTSCGGSPNNGNNNFPDFPLTPNEKDSWEYLKDDNGNIKENVSIEWFVNDSTFSWSSYGSDRVSRIIKEKTGITIKFTSPVTDDGEKLSTLIAANMLPDLVSIQSWYQQCAQLANQGYLYSMNGLIERWAPSLHNRLQTDIWDYYKAGDGNTYGFPNFAYSTKYIADSEKLEPNGALLVREDWYKEAAAAGYDMTTPQSFINGCKFIKNKYANSIPFQLSPFTNEGNQSVSWLQQYFATPFEDATGAYADVRLQDNYKQVLRFLNDCQKEGLIQTSNYSDKYEAVRSNIAQKRVFASIVTPQDYQTAFLSCHTNGVDYIPLVLKNYNNEAPVLQDLSGNGYLLTMMSKNCKRPDVVIKLLDFLYSEEGQRLVAFGVEGETWDWANSEHTKISWTDRYVSGMNGNLDDKAWIQDYGLYNMTLLMNLAYINKLKPENGRTDSDIYIDNLKKPLTPYSYNFKPIFLKHDTGSNSYFGVSTKAKKIDQKWSEALVNIIRSETWETTYNAAVNYANRQGLQDVISFYGNSYNTTKALLGLEFGYPTHQSGYTAPVTGPNGDFSFWKGATHE